MIFTVKSNVNGQNIIYFPKIYKYTHRLGRS